jgi:hypothetical protein
MIRLLLTTIRLSLAVAAVSLSIVTVQPAVGAPTVKGDAAAWAEVEAALKKAQGVSHREKTTTLGGLHNDRRVRPARLQTFYRTASEWAVGRFLRGG